MVQVPWQLPHCAVSAAAVRGEIVAAPRDASMWRDFQVFGDYLVTGCVADLRMRLVPAHTAWHTI
jgi:hypothetical protein